MPQFDRITHQAGVMGGKACIRGMRITVDAVVAMVHARRSAESILADYPYLEGEDVSQAIAYAAWRNNTQEVPLA